MHNGIDELPGNLAADILDSDDFLEGQIFLAGEVDIALPPREEEIDAEPHHG
ncbi:MAG TPA: hypothetical protein VFG05_07070 [Methylocella sp.]|nr:hypothetical protein [Methylocella sp.]